MAHELEILAGKAQMFSVKETPWHGLGTIVQDAPTAEEAIRLAGLDWTVSQRRVWFDNLTPVAAQNSAGAAIPEAEEHRAIVRDTDGKLFAIMKEGYTPLQNREAFAFFNPFVESGLASFETAGSLRGGSRVWVLARLNKAPIEVGKGDLVNKFLLLSNGHDGTMAVRVGFCPIRVVCANTLAGAHGSGDSRLLRVMHSKQVKANVDRIREIVNAADARFEATAEQYRELARHDVHRGDLEKFVEVVFDVAKSEKDERKNLARERIINDIKRLFEEGRGTDLQGVRGTYWGLYNAATEYLTWERGRTADSRLNSLWFDDSSRINQLALKSAVEMVAA